MSVKQDMTLETLMECPFIIKHIKRPENIFLLTFLSLQELKLLSPSSLGRQLRRIQKLYKLSDFIITKVGNYIYAYNTKALQFEKVVKIQRAAKSENTSFFISRKHLPIQVSDTLNEEGKVIHKLEKISILESKYGRNHPHSKPHSSYLV